jgi:tetratricopeptide (TPR) repeat protein
MNKFSLSFLLLISIHGTSAAQKRKADSLEALLKISQADTHRVTILDQLAYLLARTNPGRSDSLGKQELLLARQLGYVKGMAGAFHNLGSLHYKTGNLDSAKMELDSALLYYKKISSKSGEASVKLSMGSLLQIKGDYKGSLECFVRANKLGEELGDKNMIARSLHNIGTVNMEQGTFKQALDYYEQALKVKEEIGDKRSIYTTLANMGITYYKLGDLDKCEEFTRRSLRLCGETGDKRGMATCYENMGNIYIERKKYDSALVFINRSKSMREQLKDMKGVASALSNLGEVYREMGRYDAAIKVQEEAVQMIEELGDLNQLKNVYQMIAFTYQVKGDFKKALEYNNKYIHLKDSLFSEDNNKLIADMQTKYQSEKKQKEIELLKKNDEVSQKDHELDRVFRNVLIGGVVVLVVLAFVLLLRFREKQKSNRVLSEKNTMIEESSARLQVAFAEIEEKNKDITDSIRYAKRIQDALLPAAESIKSALPDSFILFMPRNIVSGDFYWTVRTGNKLLLAVADCTGHGVPGDVHEHDRQHIIE